MRNRRTYTDAEGVLVRTCYDCRETKNLNSANFRKRSTDEYGFNIRCRPCYDKRDAEYRARKANTDSSGKVEILNSCGHKYHYRIKRTSAIKWLEKQPCPKCRAGGGPAPIPKEEPTPAPVPIPEPTPEPEPEPLPEPDEEWVAALMESMPSGLFHNVLPEVIMLTRAGMAVWLQGPPGTSKSTIAAQVAEGLGMNFYPVSCHELMTRSDLFGYTDAVGVDHRTPLWDGYEKGGVVLLDEVDNGNPNLLAALNSALSNGHCVFGSGTVVPRHENFRVIATANTAGLGPEHGFIGRNGVDLATRDRFVTVMVPIDDELEYALAELHAGSTDPEELHNHFFVTAETRMRERSRLREEANAQTITEAVRALRTKVDARYRGSVVSPRVTIHSTMMVKSGFTLREALSSKLVGLKSNEAATLLEEVLR